MSLDEARRECSRRTQEAFAKIKADETPAIQRPKVMEAVPGSTDYNVMCSQFILEHRLYLIMAIGEPTDRIPNAARELLKETINKNGHVSELEQAALNNIFKICIGPNI